jgi:Protein of unknown function (DUF3606)
MTARIDEDRFTAFDIVLKRRGRGRWKRFVCAAGGEAVMCGSERSRAGARYKAERALFLLLCASASRLPQLPPSEAAASGSEGRTRAEGSRRPRKRLSSQAVFAPSAALARRLVRRGIRAVSQEEDTMAKKAHTSRGRKLDRAKVAGGQKHEVRYEAKKTGRSGASVKTAVKKVGTSRKKVDRRLGR